MSKQGAIKADTNGTAEEVDDLKAALLAPVDPEEGYVDIEIEGRGTVTVRPLTRDDSYLVAKKKTPKEVEAQMIVLGVVKPQLTFDDALELMSLPAGIVQTITDTISQISGMGEGARKEAIATFLEQE